MSDFTPRANLRLPGGGSTGTILPDEQVDIDVLNDNFRKIDALLGARNIPSASSYSGSMDGDLVYARDTEFLHMFSTTAGGLITPRLPGARQYSGTAAERVAFAPQAKDGDLWRDTDNIGVIWVYKAGSPGTWKWTGNILRGDAAARTAFANGKAIPGMVCIDTTVNEEYYFLGPNWSRKTIAEVEKSGVTAVVPSGAAIVAMPSPSDVSVAVEVAVKTRVRITTMMTFSGNNTASVQVTGMLSGATTLTPAVDSPGNAKVLANDSTAMAVQIVDLEPGTTTIKNGVRTGTTSVNGRNPRIVVEKY